jgi:NAD(P)-dependent dehydrogenase (short-subunit alcohol dehydrogenase family)
MSSRKVLLVTGASGLIGIEVCTYFAQQGFDVHGDDNNQRAVFFGPQGDKRGGTSIASSVTFLALAITSSSSLPGVASKDATTAYAQGVAGVVISTTPSGRRTSEAPLSGSRESAIALIAFVTDTAWRRLSGALFPYASQHFSLGERSN